MTAALPPLPAPLSRALAEKGYETLTPVQAAVLEPSLAGHDLLVSAQTGSGKTVAFGLAMADSLLPDGAMMPPPDTARALVIAPTRELALQVRREFEWLYGPAGGVIASCVGGMDARSERRALERGAHIVVGTPGRLRDHIERGALDLSTVGSVALDEADEMLDLGFREDLEFILQALPEERRTLLFSATVPPMIERLAQTYQKDAKRIATEAPRESHADIAYQALMVAPEDAEHAIVNVLRFHEARNALVFCKTRAAVNHLTARLLNRGFSVVPLSGELAQEERARALQAMRDGRARVCVATDVAARGIDLPGLELVIHADLPSNKETLLHRSGRTGRAGNKGTSVLIVPASQRRKTERLIGFAGVQAEWGTAPTATEVSAKDSERLLTDATLWGPATEDEAEAIANLTGKFDAAALAAAVTRMYFAARSAPEDVTPVSIDGPKPRARAEFDRSFWVKIGVGHAQRAEARWLLPMLCRAGALTRSDIGAIRIFEEATFAQLHEDASDRFWSAVGNTGILEQDITLERTEAPAEGERPPRPPRFEGERPARAPRPRREDGEGERPYKPRAPRAEGEERPYTPRPPRSEDGERPFKPRAPRAEGADRPYTPRPRAEGAERPYTARPPRTDDGERPYKPRAPRAEGSDRPYAPRPPRGEEGERPFKPRAPRPEGGERPYKPRGEDGPRPYKARSEDGPKPYKARGPRTEDGPKPYKPRAPRDDAGERPFKPRAARPAEGGEFRARPDNGERPFKPRTKPDGAKPRSPKPEGAGKPARPRIDPDAARNPSARLGGPARKPAGKPPRGGGADQRPTRPKR
ncbi:DEAD/DEAH box helicase [Pararhodobacter aggregans]|uniref:DEAD/DEAH box helicase n=1 Tax=Pararhodobacter aggregans TaxID=404875 RepID=UPI000D42CD3E|nr:DEAD/DEAH box helicase [Pararhodobacter aggregans]PTX02208.1 ATP-dependent RNA helicase DeaD [Pararhodobacter aggregans]